MCLIHGSEPHDAGQECNVETHPAEWCTQQQHPVHPERTESRSSSGCYKTECCSPSESGEIHGMLLVTALSTYTSKL